MKDLVQEEIDKQILKKLGYPHLNIFGVVSSQERSPMITFYRLKHLPTGLYFKPYRTPWSPNLGKSGKVYSKKPSFSYVEQGFKDTKGIRQKFKADEWIIETYKTS